MPPGRQDQSQQEVQVPLLQRHAGRKAADTTIDGVSATDFSVVDLVGRGLITIEGISPFSFGAC